jgi:hypothetical protein
MLKSRIRRGKTIKEIEMKKVVGLLLLGTALFDVLCMAVNSPRLWLVFDIDVLIICGGFGAYFLLKKDHD